MQTSRCQKRASNFCCLTASWSASTVFGPTQTPNFQLGIIQNEGPAAAIRYFINRCSFSAVASCLCPSLTVQVVGGTVEVRLGIHTKVSTSTEVLGPTLETR